MSANVYNDYLQLKETHGASTALKIIRFRLAHIPALISAAKEENLLAESQARVVEEFDVFVHETLFEKAKRKLDVFLEEVEEDTQGFKVLADREEIAVSEHCYFHLLVIKVFGCIATSIISGYCRVHHETWRSHSSVSVCNWYSLEFNLKLL